MSTAAVRDATPEDAAAVAAVQVEVWTTAYARFLPADVVAALDQDTAARAWTQAISAPGSAHVLVATEGDEVTGFAAGSGAEVATLLVTPRWGRRGHGGRLLGSLLERLAADGALRAQVWVADADDASRQFLTRHGWTADGAVRTSTHGARTLRELRHTGSTDVHWR